MIKEIVSAYPITNNLESKSKLSNKYKMKVKLEQQIKIIKDYVNMDAKRFLNTSQI